MGYVQSFNLSIEDDQTEMISSESLKNYECDFFFYCYTTCIKPLENAICLLNLSVFFSIKLYYLAIFVKQ